MKIWTSDLDSYRFLYSTDKRDQWMTDERFWDGLTDRSPTTASQLAGSAWHDALENSRSVPGENLVISAFTFNKQQYEFTVDHDGVVIAAPEKEQHFEMEIAGHLVTGRVDGLTQTSVIDYKTSLKQLHPPGKFMDAWQWRVYLLAFKRRVFWYNTFLLKILEGWPSEEPYGPDDPDQRDSISISVVDSDAFAMYSYPGMYEDVSDVVQDFAKYTSARGWQGRPLERHNRKEGSL